PVIYTLSLHDALPIYAIPDKHKRISDLIQRKFNLKVKKYTSGKKIAAEYGQAIFELMNEAYAPLYGFSALSQGQINQYIKMYLRSEEHTSELQSRFDL